MDLTHLNPEQREAVETTEGPLLVVAGAGSGKTRVLTHRIAYLIEEKKVPPYRILAVTFTNKAAKEMKNRIEGLLPFKVDGLWVGTFHSVCVRILRGHIDKLGYNSNFVIYDTQDQKTLIKQCIKSLGLNEKVFDPGSMMGFIGRQKDQMISSDMYKDYAKGETHGIEKSKVYSLYQKRLKENNAVDFNDLLCLTVELFNNFKDVLEMYQTKFQYVLVDEYQDTNKAQYLLIKSLVKAHENVCVVGDSDQSIYSWRGADVRNILDFEKDFRGAKVVKLEQNYRSHQIILDAANAVISRNTGRTAKTLWSARKEGELIKVYEAYDERDEAGYITRNIERYKENEGIGYNSFAVLYRTNAQSRALEDAFRRDGIPYKVVGGLKFYDRKEIKDILGYMRVVENERDNISLLRIINTPKRGIGNTTLAKLNKFAEENELSLFETLEVINEVGLSKRIKEKIEEFYIEILHYQKCAKSLNVLELFEEILNKSGYMDMLKADDSVESKSRIENLMEFGGVMKEFLNNIGEHTLTQFLSDMALLSDVDKTEENDKETVILMTFHGAKGLEFPIVFMTGMEENLFPSARTNYDPEDLEEERRLAYVGITRAENILHVSFAKQRNLYGKFQVNAPSRFVREIPASLQDGVGIRAVEKMRQIEKESKKQFFTGGKMNFESPKVEKSETNELNIGMKVRHKKFGTGTIVNIKSAGEDKALTIAFENNGIKKLMLSFAPLEIL